MYICIYIYHAGLIDGLGYLVTKTNSNQLVFQMTCSSRSDCQEGWITYWSINHLQPFTVYGSERSIGPLLISMNQPMDLWREKKLDQKSTSPILLTNS